MASSHDFHPYKPIKARWETGKTAAWASLELEDCRIHLFATGDDMRDRLKRAIEAFAYEMQREPIEAKEAAE